MHQFLLLDGDISWKQYRYLSSLFDNRASWRVTYDRGFLEIRQLTFRHAGIKHLFGRMVDTLTEELEMPSAGGGSTTLRLRQQRCALEPDNCYWIQNERVMRSRMGLDLRTDPPPDLALEVVLRSGWLNRLPIYRRLRVPEVWRYRRRTVDFWRLQADGKYARSESSGAIPGLTASQLVPFVALWPNDSETGIIRQFRAWVRQQIAAGVLRPAVP